jgi:spore coat polysaccharide biosynthesis protein SpsF (cytidylyltransferase family)
MKTVAVIQARMSSRRFPGKVLAPLLGQPMLGLMLDRVRRAANLDEVVVATSCGSEDTPIADVANACGVPAIRGSLDDVLGRFVTAAETCNADIVVRLTGDCPVIDPAVIDAVIDLRARTGSDYASNTEPPTYPDGMDCEVFTARALFRAAEQATREHEREHVTPWMRDPKSPLARANLALPFDLSHLRLTVDHADDLQAIEALLDPIGSGADLFDMLREIARRPGLVDINRHTRNEGYVVGSA